MYQDLCKSLKLYSDVINMFRFYPTLDRVEMAKRLDISGTTFYKAIDDLSKKNLLVQVTPSGRAKETSYTLASDLFYMLGISIGASLCKIVFIGTDFRRMPEEAFSDHKANLIKRIKSILEINNDTTKELEKCEQDSYRNYIFFATPKSFLSLKQVINAVFDYCREQINSGNLRIFSIGISSTGIIDRDRQKIVRSHNLLYLDDIKIDGLIAPTNRDFFLEKGISVSLVQNSDASVIAEVIELYLTNSPFKGKKNIASLYLGYGVGSGLYLDGILFNGCHGFAGESGQLAAPTFIEECFYPLSEKKIPSIEVSTEQKTDKESPSKEESAEQKTNKESPSKVSLADLSKEKALLLNYVLSTWDNVDNRPHFSKDIMSYDEKIRKYVFEEEFEGQFKEKSSDEIYRFLAQNKDNANLLGKYFGGIVNTITNLLNVEMIIFTGKIYKSFDLIADVISQEQGNRGVKLGRTGRDDCALVKSSLGSLSPAVGAAIYSYHKKCDIPLSWNYPEQ